MSKIKVVEVYFDDDEKNGLSAPCFLLEDGTVVVPNYSPTGTCFDLSWEKKRGNKEEGK